MNQKPSCVYVLLMCSVATGECLYFSRKTKKLMYSPSAVDDEGESIIWGVSPEMFKKFPGILDFRFIQGGAEFETFEKMRAGVQTHMENKKGLGQRLGEMTASDEEVDRIFTALELACSDMGDGVAQLIELLDQSTSDEIAIALDMNRSWGDSR